MEDQKLKGSPFITARFVTCRWMVHVFNDKVAVGIRNSVRLDVGE